MATNQRKKTANEAILFTVLIIGVLATLNVLAQGTNWGRIDATENGKYSLSDASKRLVSKLEDKMEITAYFSKDLPPPYDDTEQYVRDILDDYEAASNGLLEVRFVHPDPKDEDVKKEAEGDGIPAVDHQKYSGNSFTVVKGYRGIVVRHLGDKKTIPVIQDTSGLEYNLTTLIKEMVGEKVVVGIAKNLGGPSLAAPDPSAGGKGGGLSALSRVFPKIYEFREIDIASAIPEDVNAVLLIGITQPLSAAHKKTLNEYALAGGSIGFFGGGVDVTLDAQSPSSKQVATGINDLLGPWGVEMRSDLVIDFMCQQIPMGRGMMAPYPPFMRVIFDEEQVKHPSAFKLQQTLMPFTSSLMTKEAPKDVDLTVLARSSDRSFSLRDDSVDLRPRMPAEWAQELSEHEGPFPVAVAIEGKLPNALAGNASTDGQSAGPAKGQKKARIFVSGTSSSVRDELLPQQGGYSPQMAGLLAFVLNAVDWLSSDGDLIEIRAKNIEDPKLEAPTAIQEAEQEQLEAQQEGLEAHLTGDEKKKDEAIKKIEAAKKKAKVEDDGWKRKKYTLAALNVVGVPLALGLFGVIRWRNRNARRKNVKL